MMTPSYDALLVILSVIIATLASFAALNFAAQVTSAAGATRLGWLAGGASVMGLGIWSMHFVGMLAFQLPIGISYRLPLMLLSVAVAIAASLLALLVASREEMSGRTLALAGLLMGAAIAGMHYIGMASVHVAATLSYDPLLVALSILIAVAASIAALWLAARLRSEYGAGAALSKAVAAVVMGVAISGMHYTAMRGARFAPADAQPISGTHILATDELGLAVAVGTLLMITLALVGLLIDRKVLQERVALTEQLQVQARLLGDQKEELEVQKGELERKTVEQEVLNKELQCANARLADALREAERARKAEHDANVMRTRFVNMASHELRTPLGAIGGYVELLRMGIHGPLTEAQESALRRVEINQQHVLRLINEMLELAKLEARQMPLDLRDHELREILDAAGPMIEPQLMAKGITYTRELDPSLPRVVCDAEKVRQILINLLANSIKFTPPSGTICVRARLGQNRVEIRVSDSGPGVPAEKVDVLFTPFLQLEEPGENLAGTGLGLAISRELARAMGGELELDAGARSGATFILSLDAAIRTPLPSVPA